MIEKLQYSGHDIFKLVDTHGFPLEIINMMLRERNAFFDTHEFIEAAKTAHWKDKRIYNMLISATPLQGTELETLKQRITEYLSKDESNNRRQP